MDRLIDAFAEFQALAGTAYTHGRNTASGKGTPLKRRVNILAALDKEGGGGFSDWLNEPSKGSGEIEAAYFWTCGTPEGLTGAVLRPLQAKMTALRGLQTKLFRAIEGGEGQPRDPN